MGNLSLVEYLTLANSTLTKEEQRLQKYLTWPDVDTKVINEFQQELLLKNQAALLQSSSSAALDGQIITLFTQKDFDTLTLLYKLYSPIKEPGLKPIADEFKFYLIQQGKLSISQCETSSHGKEHSIKNVLNNSGIVEKLLEMHVYYKDMVDRCFVNDPLFTR